MNNGVIKTIADIHPEEMHLTSAQYKAIKNAKPDKPFEIKDEKIAGQLIMLDLIKREEIRIHKDHKDDDYDITPITEETGKYLLRIEGEYYIDYVKSKNKGKLYNEIKAWLTLIFVILTFILSLYSLYLDKFSVPK